MPQAAHHKKALGQKRGTRRIIKLEYLGKLKNALMNMK
jgi:hypothetical protein